MGRRETIAVTKTPTTHSHRQGSMKETHPAYGMIGANRRSSTPGAVLFDSDIRHGSSIVVTLSMASVERDLKHDWKHPDKTLFEVEMSEAQWGAFVSSFGQGSGVPCTIRATPDDYMIPALPYAPRLALSLDEAKNSAREAFDDIKKAADRLAALDPKAGIKARRDAVANLLREIDYAPGKVEYASKALQEHTENVVTKAQADIEAMVLNAVQGQSVAALTDGSPLAITGDVVDAEEVQD